MSVSNIGRPLKGVKFVLLDEQDRILASEVRGEIGIAGAILTPGYLNATNLNANAFISLPGYGRVYKTGDMGMERPDGNYEIFGRISDGQIKLRGQRLELGEVESTISPAVKQAVCFKVNDTLACFVVGSPQAALQLAKKHLSGWMIPKIIEIDAIPRSSAGKTDKKKLVEQYQNRYTITESDQDSPVIRCYREVLGKLGDTALSFQTKVSELNIDSLNSLRLSSNLRRLGLYVSASTLMNMDTIGDVLDHTTNREIPPQTEHDCTPIQDIMLSQSLNDPNRNLYCNWMLFKFKDHSPESMKKAIENVLSCNNILRSRFVRNDEYSKSLFRLVICERIPQVTIVEAPCIEDATRLQSSSFIVDEDSTEPPINIKIFVASGESFLSMMIHHALYDGWSMELICEQIQQSLEGKALSVPQYSQFAPLQLKMNQNEFQSPRYWKDHLSGAEKSTIPLWKPQSLYNETSTMLNMSSRQIDEFSYEHHISPQTIVQIAWAYLLSSYLRHDTALFATAISTRVCSEGSDDVVGPFLKTFPSSVSLEGSTPLSLLQKQHLHNCHAASSPSSLPSEVSKLSGLAYDSLIIYQRDLREVKRNCLEKVRSVDRLEVCILIEMFI